LEGLLPCRSRSIDVRSLVLLVKELDGALPPQGDNGRQLVNRRQSNLLITSVARQNSTKLGSLVESKALPKHMDWPGFCDLKSEFRGNFLCYNKEEVERLERKIMTRLFYVSEALAWDHTLTLNQPPGIIIMKHSQLPENGQFSCTCMFVH
jgi:hypothetical protein